MDPSQQQTVLAVEPETRVVFARVPTESEVVQLNQALRRNIAILEAIQPDWFLKPEPFPSLPPRDPNCPPDQHQTTMNDYAKGTDMPGR